MVGCGGPCPACDRRVPCLLAGVPRLRARAADVSSGRDPPSHGERPIQNWREQGGSDCLIKTKRRDAPPGWPRDVISAQCSFS